MSWRACILHECYRIASSTLRNATDTTTKNDILGRAVSANHETMMSLFQRKHNVNFQASILSGTLRILQRKMISVGRAVSANQETMMSAFQRRHNVNFQASILSGTLRILQRKMISVGRAVSANQETIMSAFQR